MHAGRRKVRTVISVTRLAFLTTSAFGVPFTSSQDANRPTCVNGTLERARRKCGPGLWVKNLAFAMLFGNEADVLQTRKTHPVHNGRYTAEPGAGINSEIHLSFGTLPNPCSNLIR
jgi:hypothetical protein